MTYEGPPLTWLQLHRFLLLHDLATGVLGDALPPDELTMFARVRHDLRSGRKVADTLVVLGLALLGGRAAETDHSELAVSLYRAYLEVAQDRVDVWYNLGNHLARLGRTDEAITAYDGALRINPGFASAYYNRGRMNYDLGNWEDALSDFIQAVRHNCDVDSFPGAITRRIISLHGFRAMVGIVSDTTLPTNQRQRLAQALRSALLDARHFDGWFLSPWPRLAQLSTAQEWTTLVLRALLADILRGSPVEWGTIHFGRGGDGRSYRTTIMDQALTPEAFWYFPPQGPPSTVDRVEHLERLEEGLEAGRAADVPEATWALHYASGAIALSCLINNALDWPSPTFRLSVPRVVGAHGVDQTASSAITQWIIARGSTTLTDFALAHFHDASDDLIALALTHPEPETRIAAYFDDNGIMTTSDGNMLSRPGSIHLAESMWCLAEPVYREWVLTADYGHRPESRLTALCHARQFNALAATELWSEVPSDRWKTCRELVLKAYDPDVTLADAQSAIGEDAVLIDYYTYEIVGETVSQLALTSASAKVTTREVDVLGGELRAMINAGRPSTLLPSELTSLVERPLMYPSPMPRTLLTIPYGYIRKIPIHALPAVLRAIDDGELTRVVYLPTTSYVGRPPPKSPGLQRSLFVGYDATGDIDLERDLTSLRSHAVNVTELVNDDATLVHVLTALPHHDLVHFACHGDMDPFLAAGYLELADKRLYPWDILGITTPETVVMNSCLGVSVERIETTSDGALGLHDAFLIAGSQRVIGGLWEVNEWTAREFGEAFYRRLSEGDDAALATIAAQKSLRTSTTDPFLWAPHAYFGEWRP